MRFVSNLSAGLTLGLTAGLLVGLVSLAGTAQAQAEPTLAQILAGDGASLTSTDTFSFTDASVLKIASYAAGAPETTFGYYDIATPSILHPLWNDGVANGTTDTFSPGGAFGFYIDSTYIVNGKSHGGLWYTQTGLNSDGAQHAKVFQDTTGDYYVAFNDSSNKGADKDFNDLVVKVQAVPEASSVVGFGLGAAALLMLVLKPGLRRRAGATTPQS